MGFRTRASLGRLALLVAPLAVAAAAHAQVTPPGAALKLDPRLAQAMRAGGSTLEAGAGGDERIPVWVEFRDKGEDGPASFARLLGEARAALSPRSLARRQRAHVEPLVDERDVPVHAPYLEALQARGWVPYGVSRWFNRAAVRVPPGRLLELAALRFVARLVPVDLARPMRDLPPVAGAGSALPASAPTSSSATCAGVDYGLTQQQLDQIHLPPVHTEGFNGAGVLVCVLDDGFNFYRRHEALKDVPILPGRVRDFVDGDYDVQDTLASGIALEHGAWTFALVGGYKPGVYVGAAYGAEFALGRTENDYSEHVVEMVYWGMGAEWADSLGADIISSSLGYNTFDAPDPSFTYADMNGHTTIVSRAAEIAASKGILVVNSAGNEGNTAWKHVFAPADVNGDSLIAVGAVTSTGAYATFSSQGPTSDGRIKPDLVAMGVSNPIPDVALPFDPSTYYYASGTSFSAPLVAGLAACLWQAKPTATPQEIIQALRSTASRAGNPDNLTGYGIPDGLAALFALTHPTSVPGTPISITITGPNPFRDGESVTFDLSAGSTGARDGDVRVLDAQGRIVRRLCSGDLGVAHARPPSWDGRDDGGRTVSPGLYFATLCAARRTSAARVIFLR